MFSKVSRYRNVPAVTALDAQGRTLAATDIRLLPAVTGTFRYMITAGERLDHLGYKFYSQPLQWWNICDANPEFLSPHAMLGQDVIVTSSFSVNAAGAPPWAALFHNVAPMVGVLDVRISEDFVLKPHPVTVAGQQILTFVEQVSHAVAIRYSRLNVTAADLATAIEASGFTVGTFVDLGQIGQTIVIPPKPIG
jgi:hypothetical protein